MPKANPPVPGHTGPVYNIASIFSARRDLRPAAKALVQDSGLSVEEADILVLLYGLRKLGWNDCRVYADGFVNFTELKANTVYDPSLFTRRISKLKGLEMVRVRSGREADPTLHGKAQQVRIEDAGIAAIKPVWEQYTAFCNELLKGFSPGDLKAHQRINEAICAILRQRRDPAKQVLGLAS
jgi:DNA-binding MarR family transcriptional regulator